MIGHCKDCKYWQGIGMWLDWRECKHMSGTDKPFIATGNLAYCDCTCDGIDEYNKHTMLITAPDFGCIQFEAKEMS